MLMLSRLTSWLIVSKTKKKRSVANHVSDSTRVHGIEFRRLCNLRLGIRHLASQRALSEISTEQKYLTSKMNTKPWRILLAYKVLTLI